MATSVDPKVAVVIPNWDGLEDMRTCLAALEKQTYPHTVIVVDNGSVDGSVEFLRTQNIQLIEHATNLGFAGGVNGGIRPALEQGYDAIALLNNDAIADPGWLKALVETMQTNPKLGIVTSKILTANGTQLDSTGDYYTVWGLPYPRGRGETEINKYDEQTEIFGASGGASLYRSDVFKQIGLFDEDFFAYYEDVDISFRAQWAGWKVAFSPQAIVYHQISGTSGKIKGFATLQTMKNQPLLLVKNVPKKYFWKVFWRFGVAHTLFYLRAITRGQFWSATKGDARGTRLLRKAGKQRKQIMASKVVTDEYIWSMLVHDLPPNAHALRKLRSVWWKLTFKKGRI